MRIFRLAVLGHHRYEMTEKKKDFQVHVKYCTMIDSEMESVAIKICQYVTRLMAISFCSLAISISCCNLITSLSCV